MKLGERLLGLLVLWLFWILKQSIRLKLGPSRGILVSREHARSNCELIRTELIVTFSARTYISYMFFLFLFSLLECDELERQLDFFSKLSESAFTENSYNFKGILRVVSHDLLSTDKRQFLSFYFFKPEND